MRFLKNVIKALAILQVFALLAGCGSTKTTSKSTAAPTKNLRNQQGLKTGHSVRIKAVNNIMKIYFPID